MRPYAPIPLRRAVLDASTKVDNASAVSIPPPDDFTSCSDATYDETRSYSASQASAHHSHNSGSSNSYLSILL